MTKPTLHLLALSGMPPEKRIRLLSSIFMHRAADEG